MGGATGALAVEMTDVMGAIVCPDVAVDVLEQPLAPMPSTSTTAMPTSGPSLLRICRPFVRR